MVLPRAAGAGHQAQPEQELVAEAFDPATEIGLLKAALTAYIPAIMPHPKLLTNLCWLDIVTCIIGVMVVNILSMSAIK